MNSLSQKSQRVLEALRAKSEDWSKRMPSVSSVHEMLAELGVEHNYRDSSNMVEYRSRGSKFVNSRHEGKAGKKLHVGSLVIDSSESYYSANSWNYARQLVQLVDNLN
jgi:hypothetical protein